MFKEYMQAPTAYYFSNEFTIVLWINLYSLKGKKSLIDFSENFNSNNIGIRIEDSKLVFWTKAQNETNSLKSKSNLVSYEWIHIAVSFKYNISELYLNGILDNYAYFVPQNNRANYNTNYIGKSYDFDISFSSIVIDEIKIFNRSLFAYEIKKDSLEKKKCTPSYCKNGGTCYENYSEIQPSCHCKKNYHGILCEDESKNLNTYLVINN